MTEPETIRCRAKRSEDCYDGRASLGVYGEEEPGMRGDGTFKDGTVVCDACYIALGTPTNAQLEAMGL